MKHKWISFFLSFSMLLGICPMAQAMRAYEYTGGDDPATGKTIVLELRITDNDCNTTTVPVYDAAGNPLWIETYTKADGLHWVPAGEAVPNTQLQQMLRDRIHGLEKTYRIHIKNEYKDDAAHELDRMDQLEKLIQVIPEGLWKAAQKQLARSGKTLTICRSKDHRSGNAGTYDPKTVTIRIMSMGG